MLPLLAPILSTLASNGLGLLAGAIQAKGKEFVEQKLGISIPDNASAFTPELIAKLKEKEMEHEEILLELSIKEQELYIEDVKSARNLGIELSKAEGWLNQNIMPILALITIVGGALIMLLSSESEVRMAAVSLMTMVLGYFFGSSKGSKDKQELLAKIGDRK